MRETLPKHFIYEFFKYTLYLVTEGYCRCKTSVVSVNQIGPPIFKLGNTYWPSTFNYFRRLDTQLCILPQSLTVNALCVRITEIITVSKMYSSQESVIDWLGKGYCVEEGNGPCIEVEIPIHHKFFMHWHAINVTFLLYWKSKTFSFSGRMPFVFLANA